MARVVVMGAGIGGMSAAYEIRHYLEKSHQVTVINPTETFQFTPSNPWLAVGWRKKEQITLNVRKYLEKKGIELLADAVREINAEDNQLVLESGVQVNYDYLVITTGPRLAFEEIEGLGPEHNTFSVCTADHAESARLAYEEFVKKPGPIVVGAVQLASCFGPAYEFAMILDADLRKRKIRDQVPITFVTSEPYIGHLGLAGVGDSKGLLESEMRHRHISWVTNAKVDKVEKGKMQVTEHDVNGEPCKEHTLNFDFGMLLPAFKGVDPVAGVEGLCNPRGFVFVDKHQRSPKYNNIFAAGVCIAIPPVEATPVPTGAPKTGFMIETMVTTLAKNIAADLTGREADTVGTWNAICLADLGDTGAAFVAIPQIPPRNLTWAKMGKWVHYAKVAFEKYFMRKMKTGSTEPVHEKYILKALGIERLK